VGGAWYVFLYTLNDDEYKVFIIQGAALITSWQTVLLENFYFKHHAIAACLQH